MKKITLAPLLLLLTAATQNTKEQVRIAAFEYPPIYQNEASQKGLSADIAIAAFQAVNIEARISFMPVARMVFEVERGQFPCGLGGEILFSDPSTAKKVSVVSTIQYVSQVFLYNAEKYPQGIFNKQLDEMQNFRIGAVNASGIFLFLRKNNIGVQPNQRHEGLAHQLEKDRIDAWATVDLTGMYYMRSIFPNTYQKYRYTKPFNIGDVSLVCEKSADNKHNYSQKFKEGLDLIKKNGTYMRIMADYYGGKNKINKNSLPKDIK